MRGTEILKGLLEEQIRLHGALLELAQGQRRTIAMLELGDLEENAASEMQLTEEIQALEQHRLDEMEKWAAELGLSDPAMTLRELVRHIGERGGDKAAASELWALGEELNDIIDEIRRATATNRVMLQRGMSFLEDQFQTIRAPQKSESGAYNIQGKTSEGSRVPRVLSVRA